MLIGILADTHIPYRVSTLPNTVLDALQNVDIILHAGDVDELWALQPLDDIAPVFAVSGNYHILDRSSGGKELPTTQKLSLNGYNICMTHGHWVGWSTPIWRILGIARAAFAARDFSRRDQFTSTYLIRKYPEADVYIFGHTHRFYTQVFGDKIVINPGAACAASYFNQLAETSVVLLTLERDKQPILQRIVFAGT